jgi:hypothetical protein
LDHVSLKVTKKRVTHFEQELQKLRDQVENDDALQLGSIAFAFEQRALAAVGATAGSRYNEQRLNKKTNQLYYVLKYSDVHFDYIFNRMNQDEREKYKKFLRRVCASPDTTLDGLSTRLNNEVDEYKRGRL